jgi:hypothetical protein
MDEATLQEMPENERIKYGWFLVINEESFSPLGDIEPPRGTPSQLSRRQVGNYEEEQFLFFLVWYLEDRKEWERIERRHFWNAFLREWFESRMRARPNTDWAINVSLHVYRDAREGMRTLVERDLIAIDNRDEWFWPTAQLVEYLLGEPQLLDCIPQI